MKNGFPSVSACTARASASRVADTVAGGPLEELGDTLLVEAGEREPLDRGFAPQIGEHLGEGMRTVEVRVAICRDDQDP